MIMISDSVHAVVLTCLRLTVMSSLYLILRLLGNAGISFEMRRLLKEEFPGRVACFFLTD